MNRKKGYKLQTSGPQQLKPGNIGTYEVIIKIGYIILPMYFATNTNPKP
jgi:hypothetical protein